MREIKLWIEKLKRLEEVYDEINAVLGTPDSLCIYCDSNRYDGRGIIHKDSCCLKKLRELIQDLEKEV